MDNSKIRGFYIRHAMMTPMDGSPAKPVSKVENHRKHMCAVHDEQRGNTAVVLMLFKHQVVVM